MWWDPHYPYKIDNIEIIMGNETNDIIEELCESLSQKYQEGLDSVDWFYYNPQKTSLNRKGS